MENKDKEALNRLIQFAEKEDDSISYYMGKGAKWGGIGGAVTGLISGAGSYMSPIDKMTNKAKAEKDVLRTRYLTNKITNNVTTNGTITGSDAGDVRYNRGEYSIRPEASKETAAEINNDINKQYQLNRIGSVAGPIPLGYVVGTGLGVAAGAAYGGAKKIVRLIKKDK